MKLTSTLTLAALASIATLEAHAAQFSYDSGDLIVAFRRTGATSDLEVNLGSITSFKNTSTPTDLTSLYGSSLSQTFTGGFGSLSFTVLGTTKAASANNGNAAVNTSWLTLKRSDTEVQTTVPNRFTPSKTQSIQSQISGIAGDGTTAGAKQYAINNANNTAPYLLIPTSANDSFTTKFPSTGGLQSLVTSSVENTAPATFTSGYIRSDLYEYLPGPSSSKATYLGFFTLGNDGTLTFAPVPEPQEYAAVFGGVLLASAVFYRRTQKQKTA